VFLEGRNVFQRVLRVYGYNNLEPELVDAFFHMLMKQYAGHNITLVCFEDYSLLVLALSPGAKWNFPDTKDIGSHRLSICLCL
jgi:hypothetical protein